LEFLMQCLEAYIFPCAVRLPEDSDRFVSNLIAKFH
jgi:hypothetical protein